MKTKIIFLLVSVFLTLVTVNNAFAGGGIKLGLDWEGDHEVSGYGLSGSADVDMGFALSGELFASVNKNLDLGGGITWQFPRSQKDYEGDFYFIPLYGMIRLRSSSQKVAPYATAQIGYNFFEGDSKYKGTGPNAASLDGGLYYGIGGGVIIKKHFEIEALYSVNNGTASLSGLEFDIEYSKISILFGYIF